VYKEEHKEDCTMKKIVLGLLILVCCVLFWHIAIMHELQTRAIEHMAMKELQQSKRSPDVSMQFNYITNKVNVDMTIPIDEITEGDSSGFAALGVMLGMSMMKSLVPGIERTLEKKMNEEAQGMFDIYSYVIPIEVEVSFSPF
jgi:hypothetical protein